MNLLAGVQMRMSVSGLVSVDTQHVSIQSADINVSVLKTPYLMLLLWLALVSNKPP